MSPRPAEPLPPGSTIGILGGGQLGRMAAMAAARLGYRTRVFSTEADSPGVQVATAHTLAASYADVAALARFADAVDVVTFEFENVPAAALDALAARVPCRPGPGVLAIAQDRLAEKRFLEAAGVAVPPWRAVTDAPSLRQALAEIGLPAVLKTTRLGYDGRGQAVLHTEADADAALARLAPKPLVLEAFVPFAKELSAIAARGADGSVAVYDAVENEHRRHILHLSLAPARVADPVAAAAREAARRVAEALDLVGVVTLELFLLPDGRLLGNEIAPRPHNSGHWTLDGCLCSQFEQQVRAVAGLPLGSPARHADAAMLNLIGPAGAAQWPGLVATPGVVAHWYGKAEAREGRKLGHATLPLPLGRLATLDPARLFQQA